MRYYFERHFFTKQRKSRKVKSDPRIICMKRNGTVIFFIRLEEGEQMSFRPTSGSKSPRRKISTRAYFWKCQGDVSSWRSRQSCGWCHTTIPRDNPGYPGAGARVPVFSDCSRRYMYVCYVYVCTSSCLTTCTRPYRRVSHVRERLSADVDVVWWMRRVWRNVIGTDTSGSALTFLTSASLF